MTPHFQFHIIWTIPHSERMDERVYIPYAQTLLAMNGKFRTSSVEVLSRTMDVEATVLTLVWSVDMHNDEYMQGDPAKAIAFATSGLTECAVFNATAEITAWRQAEFSEVIDHTEILTHYGSEATCDDYPAYRPQTHPDWPEADEVFFQDGVWWWCATQAKDFAARGPAGGPDPVKIFARWVPQLPAQRAAA